jgi:thiol-disulfide isomerase/thioredoxin
LSFNSGLEALPCSLKGLKEIRTLEFINLLIMRYLSFALATCLICSLISCDSGSMANPVTINSNIDSLKGDYLLIQDYVYFSTDTLYPSTEEAKSISLNIENPSILSIKDSYYYSEIYVTPGQEVDLLRHDAAFPLYMVNDSSSVENAFLIEYSLLNEKMRKDRSIYQVEPDSFMLAKDARYAGIDSLYKTIADNESVSPTFLAAVENRINASKASLVFIYENVLGRRDSTAVLDETFWSDLEAVEMRDDLLSFAEGRQLVSNLKRKGVDYENFDSAADYYEAQYDQAKKQIMEPGLLEYALEGTLESMINFGGGLTESDSLISDFRSLCSNPFYLNRLDATIEPWKLLVAGLEAPGFSGLDVADVQHQLSDLRGKLVYVDVWATWCGPCIAEIPSLKTLEEKLHDKNIAFVSVSVDDPDDKEKWKNFVAERELGGIQLMEANGWESDIMGAYNINGIPRFLLIDQQGKIITAQAPRPSDKSTESLLLAHLIEG